MSYKEVLHNMTDIQLVQHALSCDPAVIPKVLEAELLSRFNRNCGNCIHQKGICNNKDAYLFGCFVAPSIHCTYWEGSKL